MGWIQMFSHPINAGHPGPLFLSLFSLPASDGSTRQSSSGRECKLALALQFTELRGGFCNQAPPLFFFLSSPRKNKSQAPCHPSAAVVGGGDEAEPVSEMGNEPLPPFRTLPREVKALR